MKRWWRGWYDRSPAVRRAAREWTARPGGAYPDWTELLRDERGRWEAAREVARGGPKILLATSVGAFIPGATLESLLAVALTLRGAEVHFLLCDAALPACMEALQQWLPGPGAPVTADLCETCFAPAARTFEGLGLPVHTYRRWIADAAADGPALREHAEAGALRFFARGSLEGEPRADEVREAYRRAASLTATAAGRLMDAHRFAHVLVHHGIYVPQGLVAEAARVRGLHVTTWNPGYRKRTFIFSHEDTYHHTLMTEPVCEWETMPWSADLESRLMAYLESRRTGAQDWIWFHGKAEEDPDRIARLTGLDRSRPCIGLLTNVMWDAQLHYPANAFPTMLDWILKTVAWFGGRPDLQLLVSIHPGERTARIVSRQPVEAEIHRAFPNLPPNVKLVPADSPVSTYAAMELCNAALIYGTKTGVELAARGIPVIVAGEAWIRNKGITQDASTEAGYFRLLERLPLPGRMTPEQIGRARRYAWHFFFRRMIPLEHVDPTPGRSMFRLRWPGLDALRPGRSQGLDVICRGILEGAPFVYPAERIG